MGKILVLAEKPSVGREIARVLKCRKKGNGWLEGEKYIVTWALGHLVTLADPEAYDDKYKTWKLEDLPMLPKYLKLVVIKQTGKQFNTVKEQLNRKDVTEIVIATDAGREGELVARWIIEKARVNKPIKRLWISSQTDKAINEGFRNLKPSSQYDNLYRAAQCRAEADWIVGLNVTRALTCKHNAQLSAGRVQTPTLAMIVHREEEIKNFKPKDYYSITGNANGYTLQWQNGNGHFNTFDEDFANKVVSKVNGQNGKILDVIKSDKKKYAPALYDLTELQRDANRLFGYSAKQTLSIMQRLYENYKFLTYPRTDSRYISADIVPTLPERLKAISVGNYSKFAMEIMRGKIRAHKGFVDDSKVSDHHAIIPTEERVILSKLSNEERKVYDLVVKRFLSVMLPPFEYVQTTVKAEVNGEIFAASGKVIKSKGWKAVYDKDEDFDDNDGMHENQLKEQVLPDLNKGDSIKLTAVKMHKGQTKPPARFNEGTLLSAMENPQKYINMNKEYAKTLGETGGLGTVATRADIIEKLFNTFYVEKKGKEIIPTSKGKQVVELVPEDLKSPLLTAKWETDLNLISKGKLNDKSFIGNMRNYSVKLVEDVKSSSDKFRHDNLSGAKCPECGKYMLEVNGKHGRMLVCQDRTCGHRENLAKLTNARCPECHKKLELRGHGDGQVYVCINNNCNFREKASSFNKRFDNKQGKNSKRDVANYMKKMKKESEVPMNSALADALAKLKLK
ncbi:MULTISPECIES: DNA topoisomerase III [Clostridium]|uniref:DNA topoisomerase 3 n=1 Tax=Clostridium ragsdalei P11 TaxID=1353534 RepID=A0A1A6AVF9_9CLOT|nr:MULTISPECIES: DNA topoisomerase III [Clostridium]OBR94071.1 DNA topoisomerase 3 [Clostridium ragsdalei P11]QXE17671.1 DNA topoisomerase III [Clostridium sp. 001]